MSEIKLKNFYIKKLEEKNHTKLHYSTHFVWRDLRLD